ncbi:MAG: hypothetical protein ABIR55_04920, partial [Burkholderiaceae bacterium]
SLAILLLGLTGPAFASSPIGEQKTAVILVNFQDDASQPITVGEAYTRVFGTVSDMYWEASYQKTFFSGNAYGWYTIPVSKSTCDIYQIAAEADKAATAAGVNLAAFSRLVYFFPQNACSATGYNAGQLAVPSRTWLKGNNFTARDLAHEMGHSFGMSHSQGLDCDSAVVNGSCVVQTVYDPADTMGSGSMPHFDAIQKELLGWLNASGQSSITPVTVNGTYSLAPYEATGTASKVLKVAKGIDSFSGQMSYYYVEYRQPIGFDTGLASIGNLTSGVLIHVGGADQLSQLLDLTPGSQAGFDDFQDAALTVGRNFTDSQSGVSITLVSANGSNAVLDVRVGVAQPPPPPANTTLSESVGTNKSSYLRGETVSMSARTLSNGAPLAGASVKFTLSTPGGGTTILNATTGSDGYARSSYKVGKAKGAIGNYGLRADASSGGGSASASNVFSAK